MPAVFICMSNRATIRILSVMTGSAWHGYLEDNPDATAGADKGLGHWEQLKSDERCLYEMDLEMAVGFQYVTVLAFIVLVSKCLDESAYQQDVNRNIRFA